MGEGEEGVFVVKLYYSNITTGATMLVSATTDLDYKLPPICKDLHCAKNGTEVVCTIPEALITSGMTSTNINFLSFLSFLSFIL